MTLADALADGSDAVIRWMHASEGVFALSANADGAVLGVSRTFLRRSGRTGVQLDLRDLLEDPTGAPLTIAPSTPGSPPKPRQLRARGDDSLWWVTAFELPKGRTLLLGRLAEETTEGAARQEALVEIQLATAQAELHRANNELRTANARIDRLMRSDPLTGLANRREFDGRMASEWARARRHSRSLSVVVCDLDHFKTVNDTHGHAAGDAALVVVADVLSTGVRASDLAARTEGEEFVLLLPECGTAEAAAMAERLRAVLSQRLVPEISGVLTASFGVAELRPDEHPPQLLERADVALYAAKRGGRNRVSLAP